LRERGHHPKLKGDGFLMGEGFSGLPRKFVVGRVS